MVTIMNIVMVKAIPNSLYRGWLCSLQDHTQGKYQNNNQGHNQVKGESFGFCQRQGHDCGYGHSWNYRSDQSNGNSYGN